MSSYVISRTNYARAAGFIAGIADCKSGWDRALSVYDYSRGRWYAADDFFPAFMWLYRLNLKSVCLQYEDSPEEWEIEEDADSIRAAFDDYRAKSKIMYSLYRQKLPRLTAEFNRFVASILSQIEDPECERQAKGFLYRLCFALQRTTDNAQFSDLETWGKFEVNFSA